MHIDFVIPVNGSLSTGFEAYVKKAKGSVMDYGFHMAIMKWDETVSREMEIMVKEKGINSFKFFMAYKGSFMSNDEHLLEGFKKNLLVPWPWFMQRMGMPCLKDKKE